MQIQQSMKINNCKNLDLNKKNDHTFDISKKREVDTIKHKKIANTHSLDESLKMMSMNGRCGEIEVITKSTDFNQFLVSIVNDISEIPKTDLKTMASLYKKANSSDKTGLDDTQDWMEFYNVAGKYMPRQSFEKFSSDMFMDTKIVDTNQLKSMKKMYAQIITLEQNGKKEEATTVLDSLMEKMEPYMPRPKVEDYLRYYRVEVNQLSDQSLHKIKELHDKAVELDRSGRRVDAEKVWKEIFGVVQPYMIVASVDVFLNDMKIDINRISTKDMDAIERLYEKKEEYDSVSDIAKSDEVWKELMNITDKYIPNRPALWTPVHGGIQFDRFLYASS